MKSAVGRASTLEKATTRYACNSRVHVDEAKTTTVQKFHSTATGGVVGVAAAVARLLHLDVNQTLSAIGTAGTQAAGLWQFLLDATHSKQVHTSKACFDGIFAAYSARDGLLGPRDILEGSRGMGAALVPGETDPEAISQGLGLDYAVLGSSFKWHASCRHTHPSVDALLALMVKHQVKFHEIDSVVARTYQAAINVLGLTGRGETVHQSKFSMGFVLAVAAKNGQAMITDFTEEALEDAGLREFQQRVTMELDPEIDAKFPKQWQGTIIVVCKDGREYTESVEYLKGDPENPLTRYDIRSFIGAMLILRRAELETKFRALATYGGVTDTAKVANLLQKGWGLESQSTLHGFSF
jgi:aconitate decarboxylase